MSASLIFKAGALALACASTASASYVIKDDFSGPTFFDNFYFNATIDPTHGFVDYVGAGDSRISSLAYYDPTTDTSIMRVDDTKTYTPGVDRGRPSIRAETHNHYQYGLFILDLAHMPGGACGSWPAFWTTSNDHWPEHGEIDIIENVNFATYSKESLHAGPVFPGDVCEVVGNVNTLPNGQQTGTQTTYNCMWNATTSDYGSKTQFSGNGCSADNNNPNSFGTDFNLVGGGVYAMEWRDDIIQMWSWTNGLAPGDIVNGKPDPTTWGNPIFTTWGGNCDIARHFIDHIVVFDTTFCGDWGNAVWESTTCYNATKYPTCADYVGANPTDYSETYWEVRSLKIYEWQNAAVSSTSTSSASTTSTTSTSSAAATTAAPSTTTTSSAAATTSLGPEPTFGDWVEIGCYTEATSSRALTLGTKVNYSTMELGICAKYCLALNAVYFGVEYGGECYCGNVLEAGSVPSPDGGCVMPCGGNPAETCGGSDRLNVYQYSPAGAVSTTSSSTTSSSTSSTASTTSTTSSSSSSAAATSSTSSSSSSAAATSSSAAPSTSSASSSASTAAASSSTSSSTPLATSSPIHVESVGSCQRIGCYTEGYNIRALTPAAYTDYAYMSPEICQSMCPEYSYFGVEYSGECYCGNSINNGSTIVPDTDCSMTCGGFPDEYCGAGDRLDMYYCGSGSTSSSSSSYSASPSTSSSLPAAQSSSSSYSSSSSSSTSSYPAAASSSTSSHPSSPSSSSSSYPASPSSSTSSYPASSSSSTSSYPASLAGATGSSSASPSSSTISYPASPSSSTSCSSSGSSSLSSSTGSIYSHTSPSTPPSYSTLESSPSYSQSYTTETVTTTTVRTISSCAPTVTNCPYGKVVTDTIAITTTYCPGNQSPTNSPAATTSAPAQTTLTIYTTTVYTITSCAPTVINCPAKVGQVTTETIVDYTTVCPVAEAISKGLITAPAAPMTPTLIPTSTTTSSLTVVKMVTETVKPVPYTPSSNYTVAAASGSAAPLSYPASPYSASPYAASPNSASPYPSTSPVAFKGAASGLQADSGLAMVMVIAAAALLL